MFRTLVVPLDGSQLAERALPYAIKVAQATRGRLVLMRAATVAAPGSLDGAEWESDQASAVAEALEYLRDICDSISGQVAAVEIAAAYGPASDSIVETVNDYDADGVVMATHGRTGVAHLLFGSVTEAILARSSVPVFAVCARPGEASPPSFSPATARILVPQDGSANDGPAVQAALNLLGPRGELILVSVAAPPNHIQTDETGRRVLAYLDQQEEARTREARAYLTEVAEGLRGLVSPAEVKVDIRIGDPASGIAMAAIDSAADLIVMATHGRTGVTRAVLGSVAGVVLRTATVPVVLVHPQPPPAQRGDWVEDSVHATIGPVAMF
jgi:nucleotide-binding universal stress UspA family protein